MLLEIIHVNGRFNPDRLQHETPDDRSAYFAMLAQAISKISLPPGFTSQSATSRTPFQTLSNSQSPFGHLALH